MSRFESAIAFMMLAMFVTPTAASAQVSVEQVATGFVQAVTLCAKAQAQGVGIAGLAELDRALVAEGNASTRQFTQTPDGRPAWDVLSGRGIVAISEPSERECNVMAYGPRVAPTFAQVAEALMSPSVGYAEREVAQTPEAIVREFNRDGASGPVRVRLDGGEPGMPGRTFRFPMLMAFVSATPAVSP
ncbi:hypothetical protein [Terricaulis silvestris]|uniref:Uncharacterized protein n=1 Tax=Terricaulis silvestris TaxID=2686094 RepID=A0A6I6MN05_9CAUL|nr:hypothetical protein [Terricaulis silvestris]QGZ96895.1 hypothetical protein DSM104635_03760 [Terricaulis silvestris]